MMREIEEKLEMEGLDRSYLGYYYIAYGVNIMMTKKERMQMKTIYLEIAEKYHTSAVCVEKDIRTASEILWNHRLDGGLFQAAGDVRRPSNAKLLNLLVSYMQKLRNEGEREEKIVEFCG